MALWKDSPAPAPSSPPPVSPVRDTAPTPAPVATPSPASLAAADPARRAERTDMKESVVAADLTIEGKIEGSGHVRIAGRFKGDVQVAGNLTIERGAHLTGQVQANAVIVSGELHGNVNSAARVELLEGGVIVGDVKAGALTVASGARMRGNVDFGWDEKGRKPGDARATGTA